MQWQLPSAGLRGSRDRGQLAGCAQVKEVKLRGSLASGDGAAGPRASAQLYLGPQRPGLGLGSGECGGQCAERATLEPKEAALTLT